MSADKSQADPAETDEPEAPSEDDERADEEPASDRDDEPASRRDDAPSSRPAAPAERQAPVGFYSRRALLAALIAGLAVGGGAGFGTGYGVYGRRRSRRKRKPMKPAYVPIAPHNPRKGPDPAKVTIIEFSEFQCPFCGRVVPTLEKILERYPDVALVFKNHPLPFHKRAVPAAAAFLAAARQGQAWEMHDLLFDHQKALEDDDLRRYAEQLGLDLVKFDQDRQDPAVIGQIKADQKLGLEAGATGTPAFFINGQPLRGARPFEDFEEVIEAELARADELVAAGTPLGEVYEKRAKELAGGAKPAGS